VVRVNVKDMCQNKVSVSVDVFVGTERNGEKAIAYIVITVTS